VGSSRGFGVDVREGVFDGEAGVAFCAPERSGVGSGAVTDACAGNVGPAFLHPVIPRESTVRVKRISKILRLSKEVGLGCCFVRCMGKRSS